VCGWVLGPEIQGVVFDLSHVYSPAGAEAAYCMPP
jgi:hypothetical protein